MANNDKENKIEKFTKEAIGKTLNQFNKEIGMADLVEINKNQDRILNGILSQVNDENTEKTEKSNIITLDNSTDGIVELKEIQGDTNVNVSKIEEMPITHDIGDKEGNVFTLNEITKGAISIGEIQGNTMVNCNKDDKKELVLMKDLSTQGDNNITITEGVDGGKVDVALEGNTLVNVSKTKDSTAISKSYTVENSGNHIALQGDIDGSCRPVITGNTLVNLVGDIKAKDIDFITLEGNCVVFSNPGHVGNISWDVSLLKPSTTYTLIISVYSLFDDGNSAIVDLFPDTYQEIGNWTTHGMRKIVIATPDDISDLLYLRYYVHGAREGICKMSKPIILEGDYSDKPIPDYFEGLQSSFEDNLVTQEMIDSGEEVADNLGKYKVDYKVTGKNLLEYPYIDTNKTVNGITFTDNGDGSITVNGTSTGVTNFFIRTTNEWFLPKGTYTFTSSNSQVTAFAGGDAGNIGTNAGKPSTTFTIKENPSKFGKLLLQIDAGKTFDNAILYPQLEEGDTATSYEPYKEYTKTLYLNSPLLEGDTIEQYGNNIVHVHRYGKVVLDGGTSPWGNTWWESTSNTTDTVFSGGLSSAPYEDIGYCDKLLIVTPSNLSSYDTAITIDGESIIRINIPKELLSRNKDLSAFRTWLNANPITLVGKLKTPQYELIEQSNLAVPSYANGHLDLPSAVPISKVNFLHFEEELTYLYPATSYTVQFVSDKAIAVDITLGGTQLLSKSIVKGLNRINITTPATLVNNKLIIDGVGANISNVVVTNTDREFMYFEGMKSVGEGNGIEILSQNKNLYNGGILSGSIKFGIDKVYNCFTDDVSITANRVRSEYPQTIKPNTKYTITMTNYEGGFHLFFYDKYGNYLNNVNYINTDSDNNFTTPSNAYYMHFFTMLYPELSVTNENYKVFLRFKDSSTDYIEPKLNTQQLTHEPLRAVGKVKDRYVLIDGKWYIERKCKEDILNGTETGWTDAETTDSHSKFYLASYGLINNVVEGYILSDRFNYGNHTTVPTYEYVRIGFDLDFYLKFKTIYQDVNGFKQWLQNNPTTIVYQLASPTYEPIDYNPLEVYSDTTHITTNSAVPTNITIKNHGFNCLLKPSTTYTVSSNRGLSTVTTGADIGDSCLRFYDEDTSDDTTMKNVLLLEGDWTTKADLIPSNFSGIESAFEQELVTDENDVNYGKYKVTAKVVGKNLLGTKVEAFLGRPYGNDIYTFQQHPNANAVSYIIPCLPNTTYSLSSLGDRNVMAEFNHYPINGEIVTNVYGRTITTSNTAKWLVVYINSLWTDDDLHAQLEEGNTATAYEPYKESNVTFYLNEPLRGVENSKDRVFIQDDKVIVERNCGSYTFDGSDDEYWEKEEARFSISISNVIPNRFSKAINNALFTTDSLVTDDQYDSYAIINGWGSVNKLYLRDINKFTTLAELKQYLQQNPVTVVYELAEPTYEEVEYSSNRLILNTFNNESFNNSTLFLDTNISPKLSFKPLYEELVYVKNSTKYYIQFNAVGSGEVVINLGGTELTTEIVEGYNCIPITTPSESTNLMTIIGQGITISEVIVSEVVCGGYYKGLQSCFEEHMENGKYRVLLRGIALDGSKVNGIKLYINEPLRGIEDIKDRLCIKDGKLMVERKCSSVTLDGSDDENWKFHKLESSGKYAYVSRKSLGKYKINNDIISNVKSVNWSNEPWTITDNYFISFEGTGGNIYSYSDYSNLNDFKSNLNNNPMIVVYPKDTIIYEEVTNEYGLPIVFEGYENGVVYIDSAVTPTTHIKYTSNNQLATTLSEAEEQNIATQEDINMNVVTYMMDIDMILTEMEMSNDTSVMAVRRDSSNENMLDRMSDEDKKVYRDNTVVMLEKMITANVLEKEDIEGRINMYYNKNRISKEQYEYLKSLL